MQIITRSEAINRKILRYFTGVPCKRGHLVERYTLNSACIDCLHPKFGQEIIAARKAARKLEVIKRQTAILEQRELRRNEREKRAIAKRKMKQFKVILDVDDRDAFAERVLVYVRLTERALRIEDVKTRFTPIGMDIGKWLYAFRAFQVDIPYLRTIAKDLAWDRMTDAEKTHLLLNPQSDYVPPIIRKD